MKVLIIGNPDRYEKFRPDLPVYDQCEKTFCPRGTSDPELLDAAGDAQVILADAISPVSAYVIDHMPNLKLIHSEGVPLTNSTSRQLREEESLSATIRDATQMQWRSRP